MRGISVPIYEATKPTRLHFDLASLTAPVGLYVMLYSWRGCYPYDSEKGCLK